MYLYFSKKPRNDSTTTSAPNDSSISIPRNNSTTTSAPNDSSISIPNPIMNQERINVSSVESSVDNIDRDPGKRRPIAEYEVQDRDRIRREYISKGPFQPKGHVFKKSSFGKEKRSFQCNWFERHAWLEYSVDKDAAFCFWCYLFRPINDNRFGDDVFVSTGCKNWKKILVISREHEGSVNSTHDHARILFVRFKNQRQSVEYNLMNFDKEDEVNYRIRLTASLNVTRLLLKQGLALRGHDESLEFENRGNFIEILVWLREQKLEVAVVTLENAPRNNQMVSPLIQKELANCC